MVCTFIVLMIDNVPILCPPAPRVALGAANAKAVGASSRLRLARLPQDGLWRTKNNPSIVAIFVQRTDARRCAFALTADLTSGNMHWPCRGSH